MLTREDGVYANTVETDLFLDRRKPSYVGGMLEMANARLYPFWGSLTDALRTGEPQNEARTGGDFFAAIYADPDRLAHFLHAMTDLSTGAAIAIAQKFPFDRHRTVLDLGCAEGGVLAQILSAHEHLTGIGFDLPATREHFDRHLQRPRSTRARHVHRRRLLLRPAPPSGRHRPRAHPPRLGPRPEAGAPRRASTTRFRPEAR